MDLVKSKSSVAILYRKDEREKISKWFFRIGANVIFKLNDNLDEYLFAFNQTSSLCNVITEITSICIKEFLSKNEGLNVEWFRKVLILTPFHSQEFCNALKEIASQLQIEAFKSFLKSLLNNENLKKHVVSLQTKYPPFSDDTLSILKAFEEMQIINLVENCADEIAANLYFGNVEEIDGYEEGSIYGPPNGEHTWEANLKWLLEHMKKRSKFIVKSAITEDAKVRGETSNQKGKLGSGFFREIAICAMYGYSLEVENDTFFLKTSKEYFFEVAIDRVSVRVLKEIQIEDMGKPYNRIKEEYLKLYSKKHLSYENISNYNQ